MSLYDIKRKKNKFNNLAKQKTKRKKQKIMLRKKGYKVMENNNINSMDKQGEKNKDYLKKMTQKTISRICF